MNIYVRLYETKKSAPNFRGELWNGITKRSYASAVHSRHIFRVSRYDPLTVSFSQRMLFEQVISAFFFFFFLIQFRYIETRRIKNTRKNCSSGRKKGIFTKQYWKFRIVCTCNAAKAKYDFQCLHFSTIIKYK